MALGGIFFMYNETFTLGSPFHECVILNSRLYTAN